MGKSTILFSGAFLGIFLISSHEGRAAQKPKTETMYIGTDKLPPASAEEVVPTHPFFSEVTTGNEVMEKVTELEDRLHKLEEKINQNPEKNIKIQSEGNLTIESKGNIEINTPGTVKFNAKSVDIPKSSNQP